MKYPIISADSHVTEVTSTYAEFIDPAFRDRAPYIVEAETGITSVIDGMPPIKLGPACGAGIAPELRGTSMRKVEDLHRGGWDSSVRLIAQDKDGVAAEVIYPTIGMVLCNHPDKDYQNACFRAYNLWLAQYCSFSPDRLLGVGMSAVRTPAEGIEDIATIKRLGLRGIMLPGLPGEDDYDSPIYEPLWEAAAASGLPISFHILATGGFFRSKPRGPKMNSMGAVLTAVQEVIGLFILSGIFDRHPKLKIVCVEGDAGWVPHYAHRMDRTYTEHRHHLENGHELKKMPSSYLFENVYFTFQDDPTAFKFAGHMNYRKLMWANDFPHSDATWPRSQDVIMAHTRDIPEDQVQAILSGNAADLYSIDVPELLRQLAA